MDESRDFRAKLCILLNDINVLGQKIKRRREELPERNNEACSFNREHDVGNLLPDGVRSSRN